MLRLQNNIGWIGLAKRISQVLSASNINTLIAKWFVLFRKQTRIFIISGESQFAEQVQWNE